MGYPAVISFILLLSLILFEFMLILKLKESFISEISFLISKTRKEKEKTMSKESFLHNDSKIIFVFLFFA